MPGDTHIKSMHRDLKQYIIQQLSLPKGNGEARLLVINIVQSCSIYFELGVSNIRRHFFLLNFSFSNVFTVK